MNRFLEVQMLLSIYLKDKPHSWGLKLFKREGVSGIVYDLEIYTKKDSVPTSGLGLGAKIVLRLIDNVQREMNFKLYFDNFYTSVDVINALSNNHGIESHGTIRSNRMKGAIFESDASLKKKGRGTYDYRLERHTEVSVVKWLDNKLVHVDSSYFAVAQVDQRQRWGGNTHSHVEVDSQCVIRGHNKSIGGVDLSDTLLELY
ncbi:hypothetical protein QYM36_008772 [Artemia franciscana]|uniref:PiggyBac transposable element-derived protein domain-containing protein n=1 Tax=Artemia franciscana TaxID=6661 RepID=A0AA88HS93_ARTSF|nr:hypothetical protein QYM36_008772 [Artemia franciscana]